MLPWQRTAILLALASFVETLGFGHLGSFTPLYLQQLGVAPESVPSWTGILSAASFVLGLPLAPLWGVWADRYSRKLIILRSTLGEGAIFFLFSIAGEPWHLLIARMLVGVILGNTGVMYAMLADLTPRRQLAFAIGWISAGGTLGMSVGPFVGGWALNWISLSQLYLTDALACWAVVVLLGLLLREQRTRPRPTASTLDLLRALPRNVRASPAVPPLFLLYFVVFFGGNMQMPFVPLLIGAVYQGPDLPLAIGGVALAVGVLSAGSGPLLGRLAGRFGSRAVLTAALVIGAVAMFAQANAPDYPRLLVSRAAFGLLQGGTAPLVVSMIAAAVPEDRRGSVLNIILFPGYFAWLFGPLLGSALAAFGLRTVFVGSAAVLALAAGLTTTLAGRPSTEGEQSRV
jgi:MFS family permease